MPPGLSHTYSPRIVLLCIPVAPPQLCIPSIRGEICCNISLWTFLSETSLCLSLGLISTFLWNHLLALCNGNTTPKETGGIFQGSHVLGFSNDLDGWWGKMKPFSDTPSLHGNHEVVTCKVLLSQLTLNVQSGAGSQLSKLEAINRFAHHGTVFNSQRVNCSFDWDSVLVIGLQHNPRSDPLDTFTLGCVSSTETASCVSVTVGGSSESS